MTNSARPSLDGIPVEAVERLASFLTLVDLRSFRLVSREVSTKSSQGCFRTYFRSKTIELDDSEQLQDFKRFAQPTQPGCLLEELALLRLVPTDDSEPASLDITSLKDAFQNLKLSLASHHSLGLSLEIWSKQENGKLLSPDRSQWQTTWRLAGSLYQCTMAALQETALPIKSLTVFGDPTNGSLSLGQLSRGPEQILPAASFAKLESLSISFSDRLNLVEGISGSHIGRVEALFNLCPRLRVLDLHWYNVWATKEQKTEMVLRERQFFDYMVTATSFAHLEKCTLGGIRCKSSTLLAFLHKSPRLQHLDLSEIHLTDGGLWRPVFDQIIDCKLDYLHLDCLYESGIICFPGVPGRSHIPQAGRNWPNEVTRRASHGREMRHGKPTQRSLEYEINHSRTKSSQRNAVFWEKKLLLYGPLMHQNPWWRSWLSKSFLDSLKRER